MGRRRYWRKVDCQLVILDKDSLLIGGSVTVMSCDASEK
jgi:hypothetical protein